jgi:hypothetical protein
MNSEMKSLKNSNEPKSRGGNVAARLAHRIGTHLTWVRFHPSPLPPTAAGKSNALENTMLENSTLENTTLNYATAGGDLKG